MLYGRQEIRVPGRLATSRQIRYVIAQVAFVGVANFRFVSSSQSPQSGRFFRIVQIAWVLYGQASRAISMG